MSLEAITKQIDELGVAFAEYRKVSDERIKQIEATGKASDQLTERMVSLEEKLSKAEELRTELDEAKARMDALEAQDGEPNKTKDDPTRPFKSFGEQLKAVHHAEMHKEVDPRLRQIKAVSGMSEGQPSDGGFLVQTDYMNELIRRTYETGAITTRVRRIPISANSNGLKIPGVDETSRVDGSRMGGMQTYWLGEAASPTASAPKFREIELKLHKLGALCYTTEELLEDARALESFIMMAFPEEFNFVLENAFLRGDGNAKPLGILNSGASVTVDKRPTQPATTIIYENIVDMWSRMWARSRPNAVWLINQDCEPQLFTMSLDVGTGGVPVYLPANGAAGRPYATLMGAPVIPVEYCSTVGTVGDIMLVDMSQYVTIDKGGLEAASSMHVKFVEGEMAYRFIYRVDGQPLWHSALTPANGTNTLSPVVLLQSRT